MSQLHDRRIHADALRKHQRFNLARRFRRLIGAILVSVAAGALCLPYVRMDKQEQRAAVFYAYARTLLSFFNDPKIIMTQDGVEYRVSARALVAAPTYRRAAQSALANAGAGGLGVLAGWLAIFLVLRGAVAQWRERALRDRVMGGTLVTTETQLAEKTRVEADTGALAIGAVPIPSQLETRHMAMIGTTGSGKTTALRQLLDGIEARGEAALVYDTQW